MLNTPSSVGAASKDRVVSLLRSFGLYKFRFYKYVAPMALRNLRDTYSYTHDERELFEPPSPTELGAYLDTGPGARLCRRPAAAA